MQLDEQNFGISHPTTIVSYSNLALVFVNLEEYEQALMLMEKMYKIIVKHFEPNHPYVKIARANLESVQEAMQNDNKP